MSIDSQKTLKRVLKEQPKSVLLKLAIELDPDTVAESYQDGWSKEDIAAVIEDHVKSAIGNMGIEGWPYIRDVDVETIELK